MELSVQDRLLLLNCLPKEGDIAMLRVLRDLGNALSFSEDDHADFEMKRNPNGSTWNQDKAICKEVEIGPVAHSLIVAGLEARNASKTLTTGHLSIYERFVENGHAENLKLAVPNGGSES